MKYEKWIIKNTKSLKGQIVGITGATGGLGKEMVKIFASLEADLVFIDRNLNKSRNLKKEILELYPNTNIINITADQMDIESINNVINDIPKLDYLILNAGAYNLNRDKSKLGYDNVFQINAVSPYFLVKSLISKLKDAKVILVGSISYLLAKYQKKDIDYIKNKNKMLVYGNSKKCIMNSLYELCKDNNISFNVGHPGISFTNILANYPNWLKKIIEKPMKVIFMKPKKACLSIVKALFSEENKVYYWYGPRVLDVWGYPKYKKIKYKGNESRAYYLHMERIMSEIRH